MIPDFDLSAVPLRGPLAPIAGMLSDGDGVLVDGGELGEWWGRIGTPPSNSPKPPEWVWVDAWCWFRTPRSRLLAVNLNTSPAARSAVVAWLASQGHTDAGASDAALLNALRHVCGLPPAPASESCDDDIPF